MIVFNPILPIRQASKLFADVDLDPETTTILVVAFPDKDLDHEAADKKEYDTFIDA